MPKKTFTRHIDFDALTAKIPMEKETTKAKKHNDYTPNKLSKDNKKIIHTRSIEKRFQTSLSISEDLHRQLKILGCNLKKPLREIIEDALIEYLEKSQNHQNF